MYFKCIFSKLYLHRDQSDIESGTLCCCAGASQSEWFGTSRTVFATFNSQRLTISASCWNKQNLMNDRWSESDDREHDLQAVVMCKNSRLGDTAVKKCFSLTKGWSQCIIAIPINLCLQWKPHCIVAKPLNINICLWCVKSDMHFCSLAILSLLVHFILYFKYPFRLTKACAATSTNRKWHKAGKHPSRQNICWTVQRCREYCKVWCRCMLHVWLMACCLE